MRPQPTKDSNGMFQSNRPVPAAAPAVSDISINSLIEDGLVILYKEIKNLMGLSDKGKLAPPDARDLRDHLKLLFELKKQESELLKGLTDEQLEQQAKEALRNGT